MARPTAASAAAMAMAKIATIMPVGCAGWGPNRQNQSGKHGDGNDHTAPVKAADLSDIVPRQENGENDQDRDRADVDEDLNQTNEFRAEQKEKRGDADKHHRET